jgi:hypothetical protein
MTFLKLENSYSLLHLDSRSMTPGAWNSCILGH